MPSRLICCVENCTAPIAVCVAGVCRCWAHALERANALRAERGLPPLDLETMADGAPDDGTDCAEGEAEGRFSRHW